MRIRTILILMLLSGSINLVSCGPSQIISDDQSTTTAAAHTAALTQSFVETETARPTATSTVTPKASPTLKPTQTPIPGRWALLLTMQMVNSEIGWAVDGNSSLLRTEDGGETWVEAALLDTLGAIIHAIDENSVAYTFGAYNTIDGNHPWDIYEDLDEDFDSWFEINPVMWHILDENNMWLIAHIGLRAGGAFAIYHSRNGGETWQKVYDGYDSFWLQSIFMLDRNVGWLSAIQYNVPDEGFDDVQLTIYKTVDGGYTWNPIDLSHPSNPVMDGVKSCEPGLFDIGVSNLIQISFSCDDDIQWYFVSQDRGISWKSWLMEGNVFFLDTNVGWRLINQNDGSAIVESTEDGGDSWEEKGMMPGQGPFQFWNELEGWALTSNNNKSVFWTTGDGGSTWEDLGSFPSDTTITILDKTNAWAYRISSAGKTILWRTRDGGETWQEYYPIVIDQELLTTNLTPTSTDTPLQLTYIRMINETDGWGLQESAVWITRDGARTWREVTPREELTDEKPLRVHGGFVDVNHAWLIFEKIDREYDVPPFSSVVFTTDGGETWSASQPLEIDLGGLSPKISFTPIDTHTGWLRIGGFGGGGILVVNQFRTTDGGATWHLCDSTGPCSIPYIAPNAMSDMAFTDDQYGWLLETSIDESPIRYHETKDGGRDWIAHELPAPSHLDHSDWCGLYDLNLLNESVARFYVVCADARRDTGDVTYFDASLYATEDGGVKWRTNTLPTNGWMKFFDRYNGLLIGDGMWRTEDGGVTWERINTVIWDGQFSFIDPWHGWAVAESEEGEIALVYTTNGGETWKMLNPVEVE